MAGTATAGQQKGKDAVTEMPEAVDTTDEFQQAAEGAGGEEGGTGTPVDGASDEAEEAG